MRLVDADALETVIIQLNENGWGITRSEYKLIDNVLFEMPTIVPERKKGKWLFKERREPVYDLSGVKTWGIAYMCSECGFIHTVIEDFGQYAYCPNSNCGAEMEGKNDRK